MTEISSQSKSKIKHVKLSEELSMLFVMFAVPFFIYYSWVCVEFNNGAFIMPKKYRFVIKYIKQYSIPDRETTLIYLFWLSLQAVFFKFLPGPEEYGIKLKNGKQILYRFNGQFSFFATNFFIFLLHFFRIFDLKILYDKFPMFLTLANLTTFVVILLINITSYFLKDFDDISDSLIYDYFMGIKINPGANSNFDIKFFFELRPGIMMWWFTTLGCAFKMAEKHGAISAPMAFLCFFHLCFVNACYKGEQCVIRSFDIIEERFGWMLLMLDIVMVPFVFPLQAYYMVSCGPIEHGKIYLAAIFALHIVGYYIFDTANSQKDYFKSPVGSVNKGFPRLPWDELKNPKYLKTKNGRKLLIDGWWRYARHMNYTGDLMMAVAWGLICGLKSYFPFVYLTYLGPLLIHRERRDNENCHKKYGKDWDRYCEIVRYRLVPLLY